MQFKIIDLKHGDSVIEQDCGVGERAELFYEKVNSTTLLLTAKIDGYNWSTYTDITTPNPSTLENQICLRDKLDLELLLHLDYEYVLFVHLINWFRPLANHGLFNRVNITKTVIVYCKYWILNRTGLPLVYRPVFEHKEEEEGKFVLAAGQSPLVHSVIPKVLTQCSVGEIEALRDTDFFKEKKRDEKTMNLLSAPLLYSPKQLEALNQYFAVKIGSSDWTNVLYLAVVWLWTLS